MNDSLRLFVQKITKLPTLPAIAYEVLSLASDDLVSTDRLEQIIEKDPAISSKVLSFANSAFFGYKSADDTVGSAMQRIGLNNVKNIAVGISLMTAFDHGRHEHALDYRKIFRHSVATGIVAKVLAERIRAKAPDRIFLGGLLHDLGLLLLNRYFPDIYSKAAAKAKKGEPLLDAEREVLGFTHAEIGAWLADQWKLPGDICEMALYHHTPPKGKNLPHVALVRLADIITCNRFFCLFEENPSYSFHTSLLDLLSITESDLNDIESGLNDDLFVDEVFKV